MARIVKKDLKEIELVKRYPNIKTNVRLEKISSWHSRSRRKGQCIQLKYSADCKGGRLLGPDGKKSFQYGHPRQVIFLHRYGWLPMDPYCISHQCGTAACINVVHYLVELDNSNLNERTKCHDKIEQWLRENRSIVNGNTQYTVRKCKLAKGTLIDHVCEHKEYPCFVCVEVGASNNF